MIVLNSMQDAGAGFGYNTNKVTMFFKNGQSKEYGLKMKQDVAKDILDNIENLM